MPDEGRSRTLRFTCPPCGEVFAPEDEDRLIALAAEHACKLHDIDLRAQFTSDELRQQVRHENAVYWSRIADLMPDGRLRTVLDERLWDREREVVTYVSHGFRNHEIADRLCISDRTVSTHLVNIYEKLGVHSRAELTALVRAADRVVEAGLRLEARREFGPFTHTNGPSAR